MNVVKQGRLALTMECSHSRLRNPPPVHPFHLAGDSCGDDGSSGRAGECGEGVGRCCVSVSVGRCCVSVSVSGEDGEEDVCEGGSRCRVCEEELHCHPATDDALRGDLVCVYVQCVVEEGRYIYIVYAQ